jgi:8-amino-7-oxononanoate synthase
VTVATRTVTLDPFSKLASPEWEGLRRQASEHGLPVGTPLGGRIAPVSEFGGRPVVMFGSNNAMGLSGDPRLERAAKEAIDAYGVGTATRVYAGTTRIHLELEEELAAWLGTEAALVFGNGYLANIGVISALLGPEDTLVADQYAHASMIDGAQLGNVRLRMFRHNRADRLDAALRRAAGYGGVALVALDGLYSMHGDVAQLDEIVPVCRRHGTRVLVDEAVSLGVLGPGRAGVAELFGLSGDVDLYTAALGKAVGAGGGGVLAGPRDVIEHMRITARSFLFTAARDIASPGAAIGGVRILRSSEGEERAQRLFDNAAYLRRGLEQLGVPVVPLTTLPDGAPIHGPVVPVEVGDELEAVRRAAALFERGLYVNVAVAPAVERGRALLRMCVMAAHEREHLDRALDTIEQVW